jgi:hypothetical protein
MDPEIEKVRRSKYEVRVGYVEDFRLKLGRSDLNLRVLTFPHEK